MEKYISLLALSMFKFLFAPLLGWQLGLSYLEIVVTCIVGATISSSVFYFLSSYFMRLSFDMKIKKNKKLLAQGKIIKQKKKITKVNKLLVKIKNQKAGFYIITVLAPLLLSIPIGSIVVAKFYRHKSMTYPLTFLGIVFWAFKISFIWKITK